MECNLCDIHDIIKDKKTRSRSHYREVVLYDGFMFKNR